ncbi:hypothetical protein L2E82_17462 [Cichorium intybus]|uniref:Uncharacterized protein n=1 Tax=Cichorium intybus TaxID=13427 RepID=A0ACB9F9L8_CICIN|nr:hypothetical protein L2E82_17462 [Cichorium intybus]
MEGPDARLLGMEPWKNLDPFELTMMAKHSTATTMHGTMVTKVPLKVAPDRTSFLRLFQACPCPTLMSHLLGWDMNSYVMSIDIMYSRIHVPPFRVGHEFVRSVN